MNTIVPASSRIALLFLLAFLCDTASARPFELKNDTFAFSNDTVLAYGVDELGKLHINRREEPVEFGHRCFVLSRAVMQFHQFARFAPELPRVSREEYRRIVLRICRVSIWRGRLAKPIVVPGYRDLHHFSVAYEGLLKENLGGWLPTYLKVGNWRMLMGHPRSGQAAAARWLSRSMEKGRLRALYLARFPHMNHVVVAYAMENKPNGDIRFTVYDPNYPSQPAYLDYRHDQRSFEFLKRWYFPGGRVNVMRVYLSPFH
ncbi:MAG: hypothetical protein V4710_23260 [Verrucomicrobiota bacterium]